MGKKKKRQKRKKRPARVPVCTLLDVTCILRSLNKLTPCGFGKVYMVAMEEATVAAMTLVRTGSQTQ